MNKSELQNGWLPAIVFTDTKFYLYKKNKEAKTHGAYLELSLLQISKAWTCIQTSEVAGFDIVYGTI